MSQLFDQLRSSVKEKISHLNYATWFSSVLDVKVEGDACVIVVPNRFVADWINDYYIALMRREIASLTKQDLKIAYEIVGPSGEPQGGPQAPAEVCAQSPQRARTLDSLNPRYAFDRFVVGSSNQFAHAACQAVADHPGGHYNPLFLWGGVGLGKTHLLQAIGLSLVSKNPQMRVHYVSSERFMNELINALRAQRMEEFRRRYRERADVLLMDDVQFIGGKETTQDEFFHTFNALHDSGRQIVVTSDKPAKEIKGFEERLRSRLEWGLSADIGPPDLETRIAILKKKGDVSNLSCPDDVAMFLASSIKANVRDLEGSLIRINAFASLTGTPLSASMAREILGSSLDGPEVRYTIDSVQRAVADFYKINVSDMKSPRRFRSLSHPRQVAMYLCKKLVRSSFPEIGTKFGGKDHTTVIHACRKIERLLTEDPVLQSDVATMERGILN